MNRNTARVLRLLGLLEVGRRIELSMRLRERRSLPVAVILGAQKCGTSSLQGYLVQHPQVIAPLRKEVHYFDLHHELGEQWYRAHFGREGEPGLNIEASPYYLFHPAVPARMHALLPEAKLIVLLRDPVKRAYSHYWHERHKGREPLSFEEAIAAEPGRLGDEAARLARGEIALSREHQRHSYLARGCYAEQLERWFALYPRDRMLVIRFEDFVRDPLAGLNRTLAFLGLPPVAKVDLEARNTRRYPAMAEATATELREYFEPHNRRLEALLGREMGW